jgi:hypothetical protein
MVEVLKKNITPIECTVSLRSLTTKRLKPASSEP